MIEITDELALKYPGHGMEIREFHGTKFSAWKNHEAELFLVNTLEEWDTMFLQMMQQKTVFVDTETTGFDWHKDDNIAGIALGWGNTHFYIPIRHKDSITGGLVGTQLDIEAIRSDLDEFFSSGIEIILHNAKFDLHFFYSEGFDVKNPFQDTMLLWQFFNENAPGALKSICSGWTDLMRRKHVGVVGGWANADSKIISEWRMNEARARRKAWNAYIKDLATLKSHEPQFQGMKKPEIKSWLKVHDESVKTHTYAANSKEDVDYSMVPIMVMAQYAALDTYLTAEVYRYLCRNLKMTEKQGLLYINELRLTRVLMDVERAGTPIDVEYLKKLRVDLENEIEALETKVRDELGNQELNLGSNKQLAVAFIDKGIELTQKSAAGNWVLDSKVLNGLAEDYPIVKDLLSIRGKKKIKDTYCTGILERVSTSGILHCNFRQNVATGRMACSNPNLQNIPRRDDSIRRAFLNKGEEWVMLFMDYSQIEIRLTAHYSQDPILLEAYTLNQDVHTRTMCEMFDYDYQETIELFDRIKSCGDKEAQKNHPEYPEFKIRKSLRDGVAKVVGFSIIYGTGPKGLASQISPRPHDAVELDDKQWVAKCKGYITSYLDKYAGVRKFVRDATRHVNKYAQVTNGYGRIRHLPAINAVKLSGDPQLNWMEWKAERQATNSLIQGEAADLFKHAVVRVHEFLKPYKTHIINFVHDEIQLFIHKDEMHILAEVKRLMEDFEYHVPIVTDIEYTTTNWADKAEL